MHDKILKSLEWRHLALNPKTDVMLCQSPRHSPDRCDLIPQGTDLFVHRASSGTIHFYLRYWSTKQNEIGILQIVSEDTAREFILECLIQISHAGITDSERTGFWNISLAFLMK